MLNTILAIAGKPGLYKYVSRGKNMLIVETIDDTHKRLPAYTRENIVALSDISIYTNDDAEVSLASVLRSAQEKHQHQPVDLSPKKASNEDITAFFADILPNYDTDRVRVSDMRKVLAWYNLLTAQSLDDFSEPEAEKAEKAAE